MKTEITGTKTGYASIDKPWLQYFSEEAKNGTIPDLTIYDCLEKNNADHLNEKAIHYLGRDILYGELFENIRKCAAALSACGCRQGDIVTIALPCIPEVIYTVYACNYLGLVANLIHPLAGVEEINRYLLEVKSRVFVLFTGTYEIVKDGLDRTCLEHSIVVSPMQSAPTHLKRMASLKKTRLLSGYTDWNTFLKNGTKTLSKCTTMSVDDMAIISHTGGTTGEPKGVMLSNRNIVAMIWQMERVMYSRKGIRGTVCISVLPPFVNYSLTHSIIGPLVIGVRVVLIPKYKPEKIAAYIRKYKPQHINSIPAYWEPLLADPAALKTDFSCLANIYYGGESMDDTTRSTINKILKDGGCEVELLCGYGMTEATSAATVNSMECNSKGSSGFPYVKAECSIVNPDDNTELLYGQEGEICFSGPTVMLGYYGNQKATDEIIQIHADGKRWLHTGDIGYMRENGEIFITGRIKRILMTKDADGMVTKLFPDRIENVIYSANEIKECCVTGKPDGIRINAPIAFVVPEEPHTFPALKQRIMEHCQRELPEYMVPVNIIKLDALPRTSRGKVDYRALEQL